VQRLEAQKLKNAQNGTKTGIKNGYSGTQECGLLEAAPQGGASGQNDVAHRLGGVQVWARAGSNFDYLWALNFLFLIPDRFVDHCIGWRYGPVSSTYEEGISVESYGTEDDDDAPSSPPDGVSAEDFFDLNLAE
jgi:hypothetical protein